MLEVITGKRSKHAPQPIEDMWIVTVMSDDRQELNSLAAKQEALKAQEALGLVKSGVQPEGPAVPCPKTSNKNRKFMRRYRLTGGVPGILGIDIIM